MWGMIVSMDIEQVLKELQETAIVMSSIESRQAGVLKDHGEWLHDHDKAMTEIREAGRKTDERIEKLVIAIGEFSRRGAKTKE
jgi:hypothetical protein